MTFAVKNSDIFRPVITLPTKNQYDLLEPDFFTHITAICTSKYIIIKNYLIHYEEHSSLKKNKRFSAILFII